MPKYRRDGSEKQWMSFCESWKEESRNRLPTKCFKSCFKWNVKIWCKSGHCVMTYFSKMSDHWSLIDNFIVLHVGQISPLNNPLLSQLLHYVVRKNLMPTVLPRCPEDPTHLLRSGQVCFQNKCCKLVYFVTIFTYLRVSHSNLWFVGEVFSKVCSDSPESAFYGLIDHVPSKFSQNLVMSQTFTWH